MAGEHPEYAAWVRGLVCESHADDPHTCHGRVEAHHAGTRGIGQRSHDHTCIPLCTAHHRAWHDHRWPYSTMGKSERGRWAVAAIAKTQRAWERHLVLEDIPT